MRERLPESEDRCDVRNGSGRCRLPASLEYRAHACNVRLCEDHFAEFLARRDELARGGAPWEAATCRILGEMTGRIADRRRPTLDHANG